MMAEQTKTSSPYRDKLGTIPLERFENEFEPPDDNKPMSESDKELVEKIKKTRRPA
jgi:hypothetical protein